MKLPKGYREATPEERPAFNRTDHCTIIRVWEDGKQLGCPHRQMPGTGGLCQECAEKFLDPAEIKMANGVTETSNDDGGRFTVENDKPAPSAEAVKENEVQTQTTTRSKPNGPPIPKKRKEAKAKPKKTLKAAPKKNGKPKSKEVGGSPLVRTNEGWHYKASYRSRDGEYQMSRQWVLTRKGKFVASFAKASDGQAYLKGKVN